MNSATMRVSPHDGRDRRGGEERRREPRGSGGWRRDEQDGERPGHLLPLDGQGGAETVSRNDVRLPPGRAEMYVPERLLHQRQRRPRWMA